MHWKCASQRFSFGFQSNRLIAFQITDRFLEGTNKFLEDKIPSAVETVVQAPVEVADQGVVEAARHVGHAVGHVLEGAGGAAGQALRVPVKTAEAAVIVAATPLWEVGNGLKEIVYDTPVNVANGEAWEATKSLLHGAIWRPIRAVGRTVLNGVKGVLGSVGTAVGSTFKGLGKLLGVNRKGRTGSGLFGAVGDLFGGASEAVSSIGKTTLVKNVVDYFEGDSWLKSWVNSLSIGGKERRRKKSADHGHATGASSTHAATAGHGAEHGHATPAAAHAAPAAATAAVAHAAGQGTAHAAQHGAAAATAGHGANHAPAAAGHAPATNAGHGAGHEAATAAVAHAPTPAAATGAASHAAPAPAAHH